MPKHENLATALAAFQAELPKLRKDESAKVTGESASGAKISYTYGYADLAQVAEAVSTCLGQHGMAFTAWPTMTEHGFVLTYSLLHEAGEERTGTWPLPDPMRTKPQQLGSAITYARRYAQMAVTNTFPDKEDDDGAAAVPASHDEWANAKPRQQAQAPVSAPPAPAVKKEWTDAEVTDLHLKLVTLDVDKAVKLYDWMAGKDLHNREVVLDVQGGGPAASATTVLAYRLSDIALAPKTTVDDIHGLKTIATDRALLKVQVSDTETLDQVLFEARELAQNAADAEGSQDPGGQ
jgi:hypothetical protein